MCAAGCGVAVVVCWVCRAECGVLVFGCGGGGQAGDAPGRPVVVPGEGYTVKLNIEETSVTSDNDYKILIEI